jgi:TolB-like protein
MVESLLQGVRPIVEATRARSHGRGVNRPSEATSSTSGSTRGEASPSIAVLPFTDLSEKKDQDWFCDGMAEEIMTALATLPGLRVAARTSAFSFRGKGDDLQTIGDKLNVTSVLEGSVRRSGDRVRITAQLSDAKEGRQIWSERFDRELKDIFDVRRRSRGRSRIGCASRSPAGQRAWSKQATTNMEAYELLLKGRAFVTRRGRALLDAIPLFERAIALDPSLAEAHALLGDTYRLLGLYSIVPAGDVMPKARACIERALAIDPNLTEALATHANIAAAYEWDLEESLRRSDRALATDPNHVRLLAERAICVACFFNVDDSWRQPVRASIARARSLDPLNAWVMAVEGLRQLAGRPRRGHSSGRAGDRARRQ